MPEVPSHLLLGHSVWKLDVHLLCSTGKKKKRMSGWILSLSPLALKPVLVIKSKASTRHLKT